MSVKWSRWSKEEIEILRTHFEYMPWSELLLMLPGRPPQYIRNLGRKLGLKRKVEQRHSEATREKIGDAMRGQPSRFAGHTHSEKTKQKMRAAAAAKRNGEEDEV